MVEKAEEEELRDKLYRLWLVRYLQYDKTNYETFDEFFDASVTKKEQFMDKRSTEEIMNEILMIEQNFRGKEGDDY